MLAQKLGLPRSTIQRRRGQLEKNYLNLAYSLNLEDLGYRRVDLLLSPFLGASALVISFAMAVLAWLAVYRSSFNTSWLGAARIVFVGWLVLFVADAILTSSFGV